MKSRRCASPCGSGGAEAVASGNAFADGVAYRGWFVGHFVDAPDLRRTGDVEVKLATYRNGEARVEPALSRVASTLVLLIVGRVRLEFPGREICLCHEGDYALWPPGVPHRWVAEAASRVLTVRWPSRPGDQIPAAPGDPALEGPRPLPGGLGSGSAAKGRPTQENSRDR